MAFSFLALTAISGILIIFCGVLEACPQMGEPYPYSICGRTNDVKIHLLTVGETSVQLHLIV